MMTKNTAVVSFFGLLTLLALSPDPAVAGTLGMAIENMTQDVTWSLPGVFTGFSYMMGLILGFTGILKLKEHVENPNQVQFLEPVKRFLTGGMFFALPYMIDVVRNLIDGDIGAGYDYTDTDYNGASSGVGLDAMIVALMSDIFTPLQWAFGSFGYLAGIVFVMIGISRMLKTEQQGPQGPTGAGTLMTFIVAGCLFSINAMITFFSTSIFGDGELNTFGVLQYTDGLGGAEDHVHAVISAIIAFAIIVGWVSLIRGFFIVRGVSEGNSQASMMAAVTHMIGGILAINLGSVIMAVQETLGITQYGIVFD